MLGDNRRSRLSYLALLRRVTVYNARARYVRSGAVLVALGFASVSDHRLLAIPLVLPALIAAIVDHMVISYDIRGVLPTNAVALFVIENDEATSGVHRLNAISFTYLVGMITVLVNPSWVITDLPVWARLCALGAAVVLACSVAASILIDHTWFAPNAPRPRWHEGVRVVAGPLVVALCAAVTLPASWPSPAWYAAIVLVCIPVITWARIGDIDELVQIMDELVREEAHEGRELVLREMHGNLSTQLRLLTQQTYKHRHELPALHELAVSANSRLRETMALADPSLSTSTSTDTLLTAVRTLGMAVGVQVRGEVTVSRLGATDRDLARIVLSDLVGNALNAGAEQIDVRVGATPAAAARSAVGHPKPVGDLGSMIEISVRDDAAPMPAGVWKTAGTSSLRLAQHLQSLSGSLDSHGDETIMAPTVTNPAAHKPGTLNLVGPDPADPGRPAKVVVARWRARHDQEGTAGGDSSGAAGR